MRTFVGIILGLATVTAFGQTPTGFVAVAAAGVQDSNHAPLLYGVVTFSPVNAQGRPISYRVSGGGQATTRPVKANVIRGAFTVLLPAARMF